jgi:hypothetical protein
VALTVFAVPPRGLKPLVYGWLSLGSTVRFGNLVTLGDARSRASAAICVAAVPASERGTGPAYAVAIPVNIAALTTANLQDPRI